MKKYKAVFFDLDHTLWDFDLNSYETLNDLFNHHLLKEKGIDDFVKFVEIYRNVNHQMWDDYHKNLITKAELRTGRFKRTLNTFRIEDDSLAEVLSSRYLEICPMKKNLFPDALTVLDYLHQNYSLHIITNGFKEVQYLKIKNSGLEKYFAQIHISEEIGFKKPQSEIFDYAVSQAKTVHENCIMIGDNLDTDIDGAINAGIDHIYFNPEKLTTPKKVTRQISRLEELLQIL